jgi:hypothetical protein
MFCVTLALHLQEVGASDRHQGHDSASKDDDDDDDQMQQEAPCQQQQQHAGSNTQQLACNTTQQLLRLLSSSRSRSESSAQSFYKRKLLSVWQEVCGSDQLPVMFSSFELLQQHLDGCDGGSSSSSSSSYTAAMRRQLMKGLLNMIQKMPEVQAAVPANLLQAVQEQATAAKQRYSAAESAERRAKYAKQNNAAERLCVKPQGSSGRSASEAAAAAAAMAPLKTRHGHATQLLVSASRLALGKASWPRAFLYCCLLCCSTTWRCL